MLRAINLQLDENVTKISCGKNLRTLELLLDGIADRARVDFT